MRKKYLFFIFSALVFLGIFSYYLRQNNRPDTDSEGKIGVNFFYSESCQFCAKMDPFLEGLAEKHSQIYLKKASVSSQNGVKDLLAFYKKYNVPREIFGTVPIVFIKEKYFVGFSENNTISIEQYVSGLSIEELQATSTGQQAQKSAIGIPFLGRIEAKNYSLGALAVLLGFFDGFNVCSLGALVLILSLVLVLSSRKKIFVFGGAYILATAAAYGILISLWYHLFIFLAPFLRMIEVFVGASGVLGGIFFLEDFLDFKKKGAQCNIQNSRVMKRLSERIQKILKSEKKSILAISTSILFFSMLITIVEFPCSAAVPLFFAGALAESGLGFFHHLFYLALFVLFYMADEIVVFLAAVLTLKIRLASPKFILAVTLIESLALFALGFYYLFGFLIF